MRKSKFQAPRLVTAFGQVQHALAQIADDLRAATRGGYLFGLHTRTAPEVLTLEAGAFHRISAPLEGSVAVLPIASELNAGDYITISLEGMRGQVTVHAAPGQRVNGVATATYNLDGVVVLWSNGVDSWASVSQLAGPAGVALPSTGTTGPRGLPGEDGRDGADGFPGQKGDTGPIGPRGFDGADGQDGQDGLPGRPGDTGPTGATGATGASGTGGALAPFCFELERADEPGEYAPRGWGAQLRSNPRTGGASAFVDVGDFLNFGLDGPTTSNPQLRSGDGVFRIRGAGAVTIGAVSGISVFSTGGAATLAADGGSATLQTNLTNRLEISNTGEWLTPTGGALDFYLAHQGAGTPPVWKALPAAATAARDPLLALLTDTDLPEQPAEPAMQNWASCLRRGVRTGGSNPTLDLGDTLILVGTSNPLAMTLSMQLATNNCVGTCVGDLSLSGSTAATLSSSGGTTTVSGVDVNVSSSAGATNGVTLSAGAKTIALTTTAAGSVRLSGGNLVIAEQASSAFAVAAGDGMLWTLSDTPNVPMYTDDANTDVPLRQCYAQRTTLGAVNALTTLLDLTGTYTIPANRLIVGSRFKAVATFSFTRGATATACNLLVNFRVGAVSITATLTPLTTVAGVQVFGAEAEFTCLTTGAGGTCMAAMTTWGATSGSLTPLTACVSNNALACVTTGTLAVKIDAQMSAAVAATVLNATGGHIEWIA